MKSDLYDVINSILDRQAGEVTELIARVLDLPELLLPEEAKYFAFLRLTLDSGKTPTKELFLSEFAEATTFLDEANRYSAQDASALLPVWAQERLRYLAATKIGSLGTSVQEHGWSDEIDEQWQSLRTKFGKSPEHGVSHDIVEVATQAYDDRAQRPSGLITGVDVIDAKIGGIELGCLCTIMGYVAQFKSLWSQNIAYVNSQYLGYNIGILSLEMPREEVVFSLLSRHSFESKFDKYQFLPRDGIRRALLTDEERDYLINVVAPDFNSPGEDGKPKGRIFVLDAAQIRPTSVANIYGAMIAMDDECEKTTGRPIDAFIFDHLQMLKYDGRVAARNGGEYAVMNAYTHQIMNWAMDFRGRQTIQLILAQTNREGFKRALRNEGVYESMALAEVNEAERASSYLFSVFATNTHKANNEAIVQAHKVRYGELLSEPVSVPVLAECSVFGDWPKDTSAIVGVSDFDSIFG